MLVAAVCAVDGSEVSSASFRRQRSPRGDGLLPASALTRSCLLRGGDAADAESTEFVGRLRMTVAEDETKDVSLCELHPTVLAQMGIEAGDHVQLRGRKQRKTVCIVMPDEASGVGFTPKHSDCARWRHFPITE